MTGKSITVVGAGIVGVSVALWLQRKGHHVTMLDPDEPGSGASYGNACVIADYGCIPLNDPSLFARLPSLTWSRNSPLSLSPTHVLRYPGWMLGFLMNCRRPQVETITRALGSILAQTADGLDPLVDDAGAQHLFRQEGCLYVYTTEKTYEKDIPNNQKRADQGVFFETLSRKEVHDLEPSLKLPIHQALWYRNARQVINPKSLVDVFMQHFKAQGGEFQQARVRTVKPGCHLTLDNGERMKSDKVVICTGVHSRSIRGIGTRRLPLNTERGYHIQFANQGTLANRPIGWAEGGFYASPTNEGLRFAGTVELAGINKPPNPARIAYIARRAKAMFDLPQKPTQTWLGCRPTMPDSLPVIGPSRVSSDILLAFGHHHLGLTLAGITGKLISEIVDNTPPSLNIAPYSVRRFS